MEPIKPAGLKVVVRAQFLGSDVWDLVVVVPATSQTVVMKGVDTTPLIKTAYQMAQLLDCKCFIAPRAFEHMLAPVPHPANSVPAGRI